MKAAAPWAWAWVLLSLLPGTVAVAIEPPPFLPHPPILIEGDGGWSTLNGVTEGSGTPQDPYVIRGWAIVGTGVTAIEVRNTSAHAVIAANHIVGSYLTAALPSAAGAGIWLKNASNITLTGNHLETNNHGLYIDGGADVTVQANTVTSHVPSSSIVHRIGILIPNTSGTVVHENDLVNLDGGIAIANAQDFRVEANVHNQIAWAAAITVLESFDGHVLGNEIRECATGVDILYSSRVHISENAVEDCDVGIRVDSLGGLAEEGVSNHIENNSLQETDTGMVFANCRLCRATGNLIQGAQRGVDYDHGVDFSNNTIAASDVGLWFWRHVPGSLRFNSFLDNVVSLEAPLAALDASLNWYGRATGPAAGEIVGNVTYEPWLTTPPPGTPDPT